MFQYSYNRKHFHIYKFKKRLNIKSNVRMELPITYLTFYLEYTFPRRSYMFISSPYDKFHILLLVFRISSAEHSWMSRFRWWNISFTCLVEYFHYLVLLTLKACSFTTSNAFKFWKSILEFSIFRLFVAKWGLTKVLTYSKKN